MGDLSIECFKDFAHETQKEPVLGGFMNHRLNNDKFSQVRFQK